MSISSPTVLRRWIAFELARLRKDAGLSQTQAAEQLGRAQSHISNLERGPGAAGRRNVPSWPDVEAMLRIYGRPDLAPRMRQLLDQSRRRHWSEELSKRVLPPQFDLFVGLEEGATAIESYDAMTVPGLLQCRAYAEVLLRGHRQNVSDDEHARWVDLRMRRQAVFERSNDPLRLWSILDESVLYRKIGGPDVLGKQLDHLLEMIQRPDIELQVLPLDVSVHPALHGTFQILSFPTPGDAGLVYLEGRLGGAYYEAQPEIDEYTEVMNHLRVIALDQKKSAQLISKRRKDLP